MPLTLKEIRTSDHYLYPEIIPSDLRAVINDWFDNRVVADDDYFKLWFQRLLKKEYPHYNELLRIEPGISKYDWLVQKYREYEHKMQNTSESINSKQSLYTINENGSRSGNISDALSRNGGKQVNKSDILNGTDTLNGNKINSGYENLNMSNTYHDERQHTGESTDTRETNENSNAETNDRRLDKAAPMSIQYASGDMQGEGINKGMPEALQWNTLTGQTEQAHKGASDSNVTDEGSSQDSYNDVNDSRNSSERNRNYRDNENDYSRREKVDNRVGQTVETSNDSTNKTQSSLITDNKVSSNSSRGEDTVTSDNQVLQRDIETGRDVDISTLLTNAKSFIETTDAWDWLAKKIDTVFIGCYEDAREDY